MARANILAYGVVSDERQPLESTFEDAFGTRCPLRCLEQALTATTASAAEGCDIVLTGVSDDVGAPVLRTLAAGGTRFIAHRATGHDNIDCAAARELGLGVARVARYSPYSVAEFAWALALAVSRRLVRASTRARVFDFRLDGLLGREFHGRTVGIVGTGRIGTAFARIAHGFGMRLLGHDPVENPDCRALGLSYVSRERLFAEADLLSLHAPLLPETRHTVGARELARIRDDAILLNTGRGGLIDTEALVDTLRAGRLGGVGLDVYEREAGLFHFDRSDEVLTDDTLARLVTFPHVVVASHQAYFTREAVAQLVAATVDNVRDHLAGRSGPNTLVPAAS